MDQSLRAGIDNVSDKIREIFEINAPINNIEDIVKMFGGSVVEDDQLENYSDAKIEKIGDSFKITVAKNQSEARKRFSIAHELGHLFLHMGYGIDRELWESNENNKYFRNLSGEMEYQAHEFAAAFLMPKQDFKKQMAIAFSNDNYSYDMNKVAQHFNVSIEAAINRGRWLNMLSW